MNFVTKYYWKIVSWDAYDETATGPIWSFTTRSNHPPNAPSAPNPSTGATDIDVNKQLSWTGGDPDTGDTVKYDVYFGTTNPPSKVSSNQSSASYNPGTMNFVTTYYWKIVSWDNYGASTTGPVWNFVTSATPNTAPEAPTITGTEDGKTGTSYEYIFTAEDSDGDTLHYTITWGDNTSEDWVGPVNSGDALPFSHTWSEKGTYTIRAMVTDEHGAESDWGSLQVTMPYIPQHPLFTLLEKLLERFPRIFPLLRYFLGCF
jgi:hypothetical protein